LITPADAVILLWDSDISDVDERLMSPSSVLDLHANYVANVTSVIRKIQEAKPSVLMGLAGPILLGNSKSCIIKTFCGSFIKLLEQFSQL
jgi:hypothetical protein